MTNGWIILNKTTGITSTKADSILKRIFNEKKIGHLGTLDPMASGILPIALGEATKTIPYIKNEEKEYIFNLVFGKETDTNDADGKLIRTDNKRPNKQEIIKILQNFIGKIEQIPPKYSAIHIDGIRAYDLARKNIDFEIKPRIIEIYNIEILDFDNQFQNWAKFKVKCSSGTYIRVLATDIAKSLNCIGYIDYLHRTKSGIFTENLSVSLEFLENLYNNNKIESLFELLRPIDIGLDDIPVKEILANELIKIEHGLSITGEGQGLVRIYFNKHLIAIGEARSGRIYPKRLFNLNK